MVADGNCGFRAVAHIIQGQESVWPEVRQRLLDQLEHDPTGYLRSFAVTSGAEISLQSLQTSLMHLFGPIWDRSGFKAISIFSWQQMGIISSS